MTTTTVTETSSTAPTPTTAPGGLMVQLITPGWGSSGYYSPQVVENAATDKVWPKGTHVFFDHPSESEMQDRPERSVRDLAAVLREDARVDSAGGLVAEADVIGPYRDLVTDKVFAEAVGMSIRAGAETTTGEAEGRQGTIITRLTEGLSVDLVTRAGRGGRILAVLESARSSASETFTDRTRELLDDAIDGGWVSDYDPDQGVVIYHQSNTDGTDGEYMSAEYTTNQDGAVSVDTANATPVTRVTQWVPKNAPAPAGQPEKKKSEESKEDTMPQIEEARLAQLEKDAGRVQAIETERDNALTLVARYQAVESARPIVHDTVHAAEGLPDVAKARVVEAVLTDVPLTDQGGLDKDALTARIDAAVKAESAVAEAYANHYQVSGARVTGFGATATEASGSQISESDFHNLFTSKEA